MVRSLAVMGSVLALLASGGALSSPGAQEAPVRYEHRVAVSTTSLDREADVEASLERNVNRLGAAGFEVTAIAGGSGAVLDTLLERRAYSAGLVDHAGHVLVVMSRPLGRASRPHEYRLLHTRTPRGTDTIVAGFGQDYRLAATSSEGDIFHAAFERLSGGTPLEYRVFANRGRTSWMAAMQQDATVMARVTRVAPMALDHVLAELGPVTSSPGGIEWMSSQAFRFTGQESALQAKAKAGFHVQTVRVRGNQLDTLLLKPAGWDGTAAAYDLDDGPWGMPCSRGRIAGADVFPDGDTYCAAENPGGGISNRGLDLRLRSEPSADGRLLFVAPGCVARARLGSGRRAYRTDRDRQPARTRAEHQVRTRLSRHTRPGGRGPVGHDATEHLHQQPAGARDDGRGSADRRRAAPAARS